MNRSSFQTDHIADEHLIEMTLDRKWLTPDEADHLYRCVRCTDFMAQILYDDFKNMKIAAVR